MTSGRQVGRCQIGGAIDKRYQPAEGDAVVEELDRAGRHHARAGGEDRGGEGDAVAERRRIRGANDTRRGCCLVDHLEDRSTCSGNVVRVVAEIGSRDRETADGERRGGHRRGAVDERLRRAERGRADIELHRAGRPGAAADGGEGGGEGDGGPVGRGIGGIRDQRRARHLRDGVRDAGTRGRFIAHAVARIESGDRVAAASERGDRQRCGAVGEGLRSADRGCAVVELNGAGHRHADDGRRERGYEGDIAAVGRRGRVSRPDKCRDGRPLGNRLGDCGARGSEMVGVAGIDGGEGVRAAEEGRACERERAAGERAGGDRRAAVLDEDRAARSNAAADRRHGGGEGDRFAVGGRRLRGGDRRHGDRLVDTDRTQRRAPGEGRLARVIGNEGMVAGSKPRHGDRGGGRVGGDAVGRGRRPGDERAGERRDAIDDEVDRAGWGGIGGGHPDGDGATLAIADRRGRDRRSTQARGLADRHLPTEDRELAGAGLSRGGGVEGIANGAVGRARNPQPWLVACGNEGSVEGLRRGDDGRKRVGAGRGELADEGCRDVGPGLEGVERARRGDRVDREQVALRVESEARGARETGGDERRHGACGAVPLLDPVVAGVGDVDIACRIDGDPLCRRETAEGADRRDGVIGCRPLPHGA